MPSNERLNASKRSLEPAITATWTKPCISGLLKCERKDCPISGPILKEKAVKYAEQLGVENFSASNDRFDRWKNRHGIVFKTVCGEAKSCTPDKLCGRQAQQSAVHSCAAAGNAEGEKLPMFVIGKSDVFPKPRCFSGIVNLPCRYRAAEEELDG